MNRQTGLRLNSVVSALALLALFGLCAWLGDRYKLEMDLTRNGLHSLSDASLQVLEQAQLPLEISAYARENSELRTVIRNFVAKFQRAKPDITLHYVNPDAVPDEVRKLGINVNGELVLRYDGRTEHVKSESEQEFVNALQRLLRGTERWLAFLDGHGERRPTGSANHDLGEWAEQLHYRGFMYRPINLVETTTIPDNTSVLVIASPLVPLLPGELSIIEKYIEGGGNLLWLLDPGDASGMDAIAQLLGIQVEPGVVIDSAGQLLGINDPTIALTTARLYPAHPVTEGFELTVFFPKIAAITAESRQDWLARPVLSSGKHTWLERGKLEGEVEFNPALEKRGPLTLGVALERELVLAGAGEAASRQQRILVIGDGDFLSNTYVGNSGNLELGMRMINWLSRDDSLVNIPARTVIDDQLNTAPLVQGVLGLLFVLVLPLGLIGTGFFLWWRRKKL